MDRKEEILNIAIKIIDREGFSSLSMKKVGELVGISEPAVYRYFKNKEDLINEIFNKIISIHKMIVEKYDNYDDEITRMEVILLEQLKYYEKNREITALIFSSDAFSYSNKIKEKIIPVLREREKIMASIIKKAQNKGRVKRINPDHITKIITGAFMLLIVNWRIENYGYSLVDKGKKLIKTIEKIILVEEEN